MSNGIVYIHVHGQKKMVLLAERHDCCEVRAERVHLLLAQTVKHVGMCLLPERQCSHQGLLSRRGECDDARSAIFAFLDAHPCLPGQEPEIARQRGPIHEQQLCEAVDGHRACLSQRYQQRELGDGHATLCQDRVVELGDGPIRAPKCRTDTVSHRDGILWIHEYLPPLLLCVCTHNNRGIFFCQGVIQSRRYLEIMPVTLSEAKGLARRAERSFASLRMTARTLSSPLPGSLISKHLSVKRHPLCRLGRLHFGKEDRVGSARHFCGYAALDGSQRVGQEGHAECSIRDAHTAELLRARTGELSGHLALMLPQNVHREDLRLGDGLPGVRCPVDTDEQHGWVERQRRDGARREAVVNPLVSRGDDSDTAGEVAHHAPKEFSVREAVLFLSGSIRREFHFSSDHGAGAHVLRHSMLVNTVVPVLTLLPGWLPFPHSLARATRVARASTNALRC